MAALGVACPYFSRYGPLPFGVPFAAWIVLLVFVAWYDDAALRGRMTWWFVGILDLYLGVLGGWHPLRPPVVFFYDIFAFDFVVGFLPVLLVFVLARWSIVGLLNKCRRFIRDDECIRCGYPLRQLEGDCCPECGTPFDASALRNEIRLG